MNPIIIAGFGRSGTTWVSDIVSKTLGGLILFEPDHPSVFAESKETLYNPNLIASDLQKHTNVICNKENRDVWLLRNHLISNSELPKELLDSVWLNSDVIGFKCIRWNHALPTLATLSGKKLIYIVRHPFAVISSLMKRPRFFMDFDWNTHWKLFKERNPLKEIDLEQYDDSEMSIKYAAMWSITNIKALGDLESLKIPFWSYEKLYRRPYDTAKSMNDFLGYSEAKIHPSYIFYPSMSTQRTFHTNMVDWPSYKENENEVFWKGILDNETCCKLDLEIQKIASLYPKIEAVFRDLGYLRS